MMSLEEYHKRVIENLKIGLDGEDDPEAVERYIAIFEEKYLERQYEEDKEIAEFSNYRDVQTDHSFAASMCYPGFEWCDGPDGEEVIEKKLLWSTNE